MQLYDEMIAKRKQREEEIANMTQGVHVKCRDNHGHEHKLTIGEIYKVRAEQKEHLNIKVRDDRGEITLASQKSF